MWGDGVLLPARSEGRIHLLKMKIIDDRREEEGPRGQEVHQDGRGRLKRNLSLRDQRDAVRSPTGGTRTNHAWTDGQDRTATMAHLGRMEAVEIGQAAPQTEVTALGVAWSGSSLRFTSRRSEKPQSIPES